MRVLKPSINDYNSILFLIEMKDRSFLYKNLSLLSLTSTFVLVTYVYTKIPQKMLNVTFVNIILFELTPISPLVRVSKN